MSKNNLQIYSSSTTPGTSTAVSLLGSVQSKVKFVSKRFDTALREIAEWMAADGWDTSLIPGALERALSAYSPSVSVLVLLGDQEPAVMIGVALRSVPRALMDGMGLSQSGDPDFSREVIVESRLSIPALAGEVLNNLVEEKVLMSRPCCSSAAAVMRVASLTNARDVEPEITRVMIACGLYLEGMMPRDNFGGEPSVIPLVTPVAGDKELSEEIDD